VNVVEALQFDLVHENVNKLAIKNEIDLMVMGSHGASGIKEIIFGSNAQKILRRSECPVLTVKQRPDSLDFKNIVFASNFNPEVEGAFFSIQRFAEIFDAKIHLLRICTVGEFETTKVCHEKMHHLAKETGLKDYTVNVYNNHTLESGVREFTEMIGADLVAIATHGRDGLFHILMGSRAEELVNHERIPVLSMTIQD
jgi:nucleotide-binding universal stress UspA family protein